MNEKIKILLADDHSILTDGLKMIIEKWNEFDLVGIAEDGLEAVLLCEERQPDIVIMDMQMPRLSGAEAIIRIKKRLPDVKVLVFTTFDDSETVLQAMEAGCDGFLLKVIDADKLRSALLSIHGGIGVFDEGVLARLQENMSRKAQIGFTVREISILNYVCQGMTNSEMAAEMGLRTGTVKNLISLLLNKTNCISRSQLARYASKNKLV